MNRLSKILNTDPKKYPPRIKAILFCVFMLPIISFCILMAITSYIRGSKNLNDLTHVSGIIDKTRYMKHLNNSTKYRAAYYEDILVFSIKGLNQEFGFLQNDGSFNGIERVYHGDNETAADIYYDNAGQRIEENVTLHTFDLKINDKRYVNIEDIKSREMKVSCIFFWIVIILVWFTYVVIEKNSRKERSR